MLFFVSVTDNKKNKDHNKPKRENNGKTVFNGIAVN